MDEVTEEVLRYQKAVRDDTAVPMPIEPIVKNRNSLELEQLFPSVCLLTMLARRGH